MKQPQKREFTKMDLDWEIQNKPRLGCAVLQELKDTFNKDKTLSNSIWDKEC